jgi:hypothetical protein
MGAGKKGGLSENRDIENGHIGNRCISNTFDDVISDISIAKNGHIGLDIFRKSEYIGNRYFRYL